MMGGGMQEEKNIMITAKKLGYHGGLSNQPFLRG